MLVLSRKAGEQIRIGNNITLTVVEIQGNRMRLGIDAPRECKILRSELRQRSAPAERGDCVPANGRPSYVEFELPALVGESLLAFSGAPV